MMEAAIPPALIWAIAIASFILGCSIGALIGVALVWDSRFNAGRRYGYGQGREWREDQDALDRIRAVM